MDEIRMLRSFAVCRANAMSDKFRDALYQWIVENGLSTSQEPMSPEQLTKAASEALGLSAPLPFACIMNGVNLAAEHGTVTSTEDSLYSLTPTRRDALVEVDRRLSESRAAFATFVTTYTDQALEDRSFVPKNGLAIVSVAEKTLQEVFSDCSEETSHMFAGQTPDDNWSDSILIDGPSIVAAIDTRLLDYEDCRKSGFLRAKVAQCIYEALCRLPPEAGMYVVSMHQRVIHSRILMLDPKLQRFERRHLTNLKIYLDANVLLTCLFPLGVNCFAVRSVVKGLARVGCHLFISSSTLNEAQARIDSSIAFAHAPRATDNSLWQYRPSNEPFSHYVVQKATNPHLRWDAYVPLYKQGNLETHILNEFSIQVNSEKEDSLDDDKRLSFVQEVIERVKQNRYEDLLRKGAEAKPLRSEAVAVDARNFLLMHILRKQYPSTVLGSSVWFMTLDRQLMVAQKELVSEFPRPVIRDLQTWAQILAAFDVPDMTHAGADAYNEFLLQSSLGLISADPDVGDSLLTAVLVSGMRQDVFTPDRRAEAEFMIRDMQKSKELREIEQYFMDQSKSIDERFEELIADVKSLIGPIGAVRNPQPVTNVWSKALAEHGERLSAALTDLDNTKRQLRQRDAEYQTVRTQLETLLTKREEQSSRFLHRSCSSIINIIRSAWRSLQPYWIPLVLIAMIIAGYIVLVLIK